MAVRDEKQGKIPAGNAPAAKPVRRDYVEEIRRRAEKVSKARALNKLPVTGDDFARRQQEQIEKHMARLRSEALQARHLAQHIDNLSQDVAIRKRNRAMTDTTTVDPGNALRNQRRSSDKPRAATKTSSFNPLHPSMELPPEELIRLLGLESKKLRKQRKKSRHDKRRKTAGVQVSPLTPEDGLAALTSQAPAEQTKEGTWESAPDPVQRPTKSQRRRREAHAFEERRGRLLVPAIAIGLISGIALSVYLFWGQPASSESTVTATPGAGQSSVARKPVATASTRKTEPVSRTPRTPVAPPKARAVPIPANDPAWQATIRAQDKRLRAEAEKRFDARMKAMQSGVQRAPAALPVPGSPEPAIDDTARVSAADQTAITPVADNTVPVPAAPTGMDSGIASPEEQPGAVIPPGESPQPVDPAFSTAGDPAPAPEIENPPEVTPADALPAGPAEISAEQPESTATEIEDTQLSADGNPDLF